MVTKNITILSLASHFDRTVGLDTINRLKRRFHIIEGSTFSSKQEAYKAIMDALENEGLKYISGGRVGYLNPDTLRTDPVEDMKISAVFNEDFTVTPKVIELRQGKPFKKQLPPGPYTFDPDKLGY